MSDLDWYQDPDDLRWRMDDAPSIIRFPVRAFQWLLSGVALLVLVPVAAIVGFAFWIGASPKVGALVVVLGVSATVGWGTATGNTTGMLFLLYGWLILVVAALIPLAVPRIEDRFRRWRTGG